jgi:hypothetical protein
MRANNFKRRGLVVALAVGALFATQPAVADSLTFNGLAYSGADTVHIVDTAASPVAEYVYSGGFSMTDTSAAWTMGGVTTAQNASFTAWCIDIYDSMASARYTLKRDAQFLASTHVPLDAVRTEALERLASNNLALVSDARTSSAFQLAAWEIMAENSSTYSLSGGNFYTYGDALGADTLAQTWLNNLGTATPTSELYVWRADVQGSTQDLAVFAPVPEPETYAMMLAGLALMGFIARRRMGADTA